MKKRLHDKKAGIAILLALIVISVAEMIFRTFAMGTAILSTPNVGEQVAVVALAALILIFTAMGKDRVCYILYGAWVGYFVLDQIFEIVGAVSACIARIAHPGVRFIVVLPFILRIIGMIGIIIIGAMLVEYMEDGTICNRAFNAVCLITALAFIAYAAIVIYGFIDERVPSSLLAMFNILYNVTMVFMFTFFAYDSAKRQLKKTDLTN